MALLCIWSYHVSTVGLVFAMETGTGIPLGYRHNRFRN